MSMTSASAMLGLPPYAWADEPSETAARRTIERSAAARFRERLAEATRRDLERLESSAPGPFVGFDLTPARLVPGYARIPDEAIAGGSRSVVLRVPGPADGAPAPGI